MKLREFLNTCDSWDCVRIRTINEGCEICFDPIDDTEVVGDFYAMRDISEKYLNSDIQLWSKYFSMTAEYDLEVCI